jgi:hypothetical protein
VQTVLGEAGSIGPANLVDHRPQPEGKNQILGSYASRTKLMAQKVIATLENTWLADIGANLVVSTVNQTVNRGEIIPLKTLRA